MSDVGPGECFSLPYRVVSDLTIDLDLYLPPLQENFCDPRPVLVYLHGGGLTVGEKTSWFPVWVYRRAMAAGYAFISANYRLLPPATGKDVIEDMKDLFQFIYRDINDSMRARGRMDGVDPQRVAVIGTSAGGLCAYLAGIHVQPKPKAIISLYGMGGNFFTPHYLSAKVETFFRGRELLDPASFLEYLYPNSLKATPTCSSPLSFYGKDHIIPGYPSNPRMLLARLYLQLGTFLDYWTGEHEPSLSEELRAHLGTIEPGTNTTFLSIIPPKHHPIFPQFHVSAFPPTVLIHGGKDTAVPADESRSLYHSLLSNGVPAILRICDGMEHSFDYEADAEEQWGATFDEVFRFIATYFTFDGSATPTQNPDTAKINSA